MFNNEMMADVHFVVGPAGGTQRVPGHKVKRKEPSAGVSGSCMFVDLTRLVCPLLHQYVLAVGSSVFHAMFYGELAEDQDEIRIPDVEPPSFLAMLKYVGTWVLGAGYSSPAHYQMAIKRVSFFFPACAPFIFLPLCSQVHLL